MYVAETSWIQLESEGYSITCGSLQRRPKSRRETARLGALEKDFVHEGKH